MSHHATDPSAVARLHSGELVGNGPAGGPTGFATLQLSMAGCWTVTLTMGLAVLEYALYAYPWECRPARDQIFAPPPGVTREPCRAP